MLKVVRESIKRAIQIRESANHWMIFDSLMELQSSLLNRVEKLSQLHPGLQALPL
ncbi:hypothetical protein [Devosia sp. A16]|uniref:hypothetical protein n=1 Tax=Devosia sp. A16 TaxID=1736675 RepID=UPI000AD08B64|nr:hypothetical protein [Devosia sp. A16]